MRLAALIWESGNRRIGNVATRNGQGYAYSPSHKHAVTSYAGVSYAYDANGSMIGRGGQCIIYDADNRPAQVDTGGSVPCSFGYDGDGKRLKRTDFLGTVHYVGAYERNVTTGEATKYYQAPFGKQNRLIGFRKGSDLRFVGTDHLGSTILVTDASFVPVDRLRYKPFGEGRDAGSDLGTDHRFTGQTERHRRRRARRRSQPLLESGR